MEFEFLKLKWIRMGTAALQLYRVLQILITYFIYQKYHLSAEEWFYVVLVIGLLILFLLNKKTIWVAALLAYFVPAFDVVFFSSNFSTVVFKMICIFYALWTWRLNIYKRSDKQDESVLWKELNRLYALLFVVFGLQNLFSGILHIRSPYWGSGEALGMVLVHPYYGNLSALFTQWLLADEGSFIAVSKILTWSMLIGQVLLIPMYILKRGRWLSFIWVAGLVFWMFVLLGVSFFAWFTLCFAVLIYWRREHIEYGIGLLSVKKMGLSFRRMFYTGSILCLLFVLLKMPYVSLATDKAFWFIREWDTKLFVAKKLAYVGLFEPDVFNTNHLEGGQKWMRIYRVNNNVKKEVPFFGPNGEKRNYFNYDPLYLNNHGSDFIMYGNVLSYVLGIDTFTYQNSSLPYKMKGRVFERLVRFDKNYHSPDADQKYEVEFWQRKYPTQNGKVSWNWEKYKTETRTFTATNDSLIWNPKP